MLSECFSADKEYGTFLNKRYYSNVFKKSVFMSTACTLNYIVNYIVVWKCECMLHLDQSNILCDKHEQGNFVFQIKYIVNLKFYFALFSRITSVDVDMVIDNAHLFVLKSFFNLYFHPMLRNL